MESATLAFGSLFLGLMVGLHPVELLVSPPVASVELRLDGSPVATLSSPPWRTQVDFGPDLLPHHLDAIGHDISGREVARCRQRINLPRPPAEVEVALERDSEGRWSGARFSYQATEWNSPRKVRAELNGVEIPIEEAFRVRWQPVGRESLHFLRVTVDFGEGALAARDVVFGGDVAAQTQSVLTGLTLQYRRPSHAPSLEALQGLVTVAGKQVRVVAVEHGHARLVVVVDPAVRAHVFASISEVLGWRRGKPATGESEALRWRRPKLLTEGPDTIFWIDPTPAIHARRDGHHMVFPVRGADEIRLDELLQVLGVILPVSTEVPDTRLAGATAVAGLVASATNQRRAVLLITADVAHEADPAPITRTRTLLDALGVPLVVWSPSKAVARRAHGHWGNIIDVSTAFSLAKAEIALQRLLARQHVCWVEGDWLPQTLSLDPALRELAIAGR